MISKYEHITLLVFCLMVLSLCCSHDNLASGTYRGDWDIALAGDYVGNGWIVVGSDGRFFNDISLNDGGSITISGTIRENGVVEAQMIKGDSYVGFLKGNINHSGGSGTWQTNDGLAGTWNISPIFF